MNTPVSEEVPSPLGVYEWEHEGFRTCILELVSDRVVAGLGAIPAFGPLGRVLRETPVFLHNCATVRALGGQAVTDGALILVDRATIAEKGEQAFLGVMGRAILQAVALRSWLVLSEKGCQLPGIESLHLPHARLVTSSALLSALRHDAPDVAASLEARTLSPSEQEQDRVAIVDAFRLPFEGYPAVDPAAALVRTVNSLATAPSIAEFSRLVSLPEGHAAAVKRRRLNIAP